MAAAAPASGRWNDGQFFYASSNAAVQTALAWLPSKGDQYLTVLAASLGSVEVPGSFRIAHFGLARNTGTGAQPRFEPLLPLPADLSVDQHDHATALQPTALHPALASSHPLPLTPTLRQPEAGKPKGGLWLTAAGIAAWQRGAPLDKGQGHWLAASELWQLDPRLGIALEAGKNTAAKGQLYTSEAVALTPGVAFIAQVQGAEGVLPDSGLLRFGGDGHGARLREGRCVARVADTGHPTDAERHRHLSSPTRRTAFRQALVVQEPSHAVRFEDVAEIDQPSAGHDPHRPSCSRRPER